MKSTESLLSELQCEGKHYRYYDLTKLNDPRVDQLPKSLKILLENQLRHFDGENVGQEIIDALLNWVDTGTGGDDINFSPARVLMQDFTGVPAIVDLAAMRDAVAKRGGDVSVINPQIPVDLVIDHSVTVDQFGSPQAFQENVAKEMERNVERYRFLKWGQSAFDNFNVVPPGTGICHQVNLEYLAQVVFQGEDAQGPLAYPDTVLGTDSHTPMVNGLGVLGWGVGGIEAEAALLGQPYSMMLPDVVGFEMQGALNEGVTATDLVLTVVEILRREGVVGKFVEFFGDGLAELSVADRATIANMAPEYGATCGYFPVDEATLAYLKLSGRSTDTVALTEAYCKAQGLWRHPGDAPRFSQTIQLDLGSVEPSLAGPSRPQDRVVLGQLGKTMADYLAEKGKDREEFSAIPDMGEKLHHGDVVIAAITSCTNTSNPDVMIAAGLVARRARERGLRVKPWVKTSLAPGSKVVSQYLADSGLQEDLDSLGFDIVGYGCTTCIGNSGPLPEPISKAIDDKDMLVSALLSGNRNFDGRIHPQVKASWLASPPLVVAFALAGTTLIDLQNDPIGKDKQGNKVYLKDLWPSSDDIQEIRKIVSGSMYREAYSDVFTGTEEWRELEVEKSDTYQWQDDSTYIRLPTFFENLKAPEDTLNSVHNARVIGLFGDSITTDHISPAGKIADDSPASHYLQSLGVAPTDFNSYGSRRGNHEVMLRGTFANVRLNNRMVGKEGGYTLGPNGTDILSIYDAAMKYQQQNTPLVVLAGKQYGTGSSRDWAAKGTLLLGIRAVIAESFERIHRSNLIGMGVLPIELDPEVRMTMLELDGSEEVDIVPCDDILTPKQTLRIILSRHDGSRHEVLGRSRIDTRQEAEYYRHGGILQYVLAQLQK
ncbi:MULTISPECIES: aconitate hydratase AcnA [Spongiibacter]|uniref:aconitate hydratase AcnA n=1 Tax=Spongiibacter TaxID=630749 RepID=UPI000C541E94|nr:MULTISPECIES: aconitate hydratase AcnA [Spongiibacter]MAY37257.1 aconitate hydratase AcnA [Spongiibacter sp.]MBI57857.1 aconitate hydratase AcnA [Spongiibacter sp.]|tara:strand:- start:15422 stop:18070 length:2649 start_codon:yes stop_codon:yes gene_type:complete